MTEHPDLDAPGLDAPAPVTSALPTVWIMPSHQIPEAEVENLARRIRRHLTQHTGPGPLVVGIDGRSGAGKSSLAARLCERLSTSLDAPSAPTPQHDDGAHPPAHTAAVTLFALEDLYPGWDGLAEGVEILAGLLTRLRAGEDATWRAWDWQRSCPEETEQTLSAQTEVLIVEGVGATVPGHPGSAPDVGVWLYLEAPVRRMRALRRDGEIYRGHWNRWAAQEERLFGL